MAVIEQHNNHACCSANEHTQMSIMLVSRRQTFGGRTPHIPAESRHNKILVLTCPYNPSASRTLSSLLFLRSQKLTILRMRDKSTAMKKYMALKLSDPDWCGWLPRVVHSQYSIFTTCGTLNARNTPAEAEDLQKNSFFNDYKKKWEKTCGLDLQYLYGHPVAELQSQCRDPRFWWSCHTRLKPRCPSPWDGNGWSKSSHYGLRTKFEGRMSHRHNHREITRGSFWRRRGRRY